MLTQLAVAALEEGHDSGNNRIFCRCCRSVRSHARPWIRTDIERARDLHQYAVSVYSLAYLNHRALRLLCESCCEKVWEAAGLHRSYHFALHRERLGSSHYDVPIIPCFEDCWRLWYGAIRSLGSSDHRGSLLCASASNSSSRLESLPPLWDCWSIFH